MMSDEARGSSSVFVLNRNRAGSPNRRGIFVCCHGPAFEENGFRTISCSEVSRKKGVIHIGASCIHLDKWAFWDMD